MSNIQAPQWHKDSVLSVGKPSWENGQQKRTAGTRRVQTRPRQKGQARTNTSPKGLCLCQTSATINNSRRTAGRRKLIRTPPTPTGIGLHYDHWNRVCPHYARRNEKHRQHKSGDPYCTHGKSHGRKKRIQQQQSLRPARINNAKPQHESPVRCWSYRPTAQRTDWNRQYPALVWIQRRRQHHLVSRKQPLTLSWRVLATGPKTAVNKSTEATTSTLMTDKSPVQASNVTRPITQRQNQHSPSLEEAPETEQLNEKVMRVISRRAIA